MLLRDLSTTPASVDNSKFVSVLKVPELLAPAGSLDAVRAAIANGANSVYLGVERFNARDEGAQLSFDELDQACAMARARGVRVYLTLNVLINQMAGRLTIVATIFLPLTFATGFFGMNFGWLVRHIDSAESFLILGVAGMILPLITVAVLLVRAGYVRGR